MKNLIVLAFTLLIISHEPAQAADDEKNPKQGNITIKTNLLPGFLYFVKGQLNLSPDSLTFTPASECFEWKLLGKIYPCHNELIKTLRIPVSNISVIKRRNTLLIFPNKFLIKLKDGRRYKFFSYKRRSIIRSLKTNPQYATGG